MIRREWTQMILWLGKHILDQLLEAPIKLLATATGLGEHESPLVDEITKIAFALGGKLWRTMAVEKNNRALQQELHGGRARVDNLPRQQAFPVTRHDTDQIADVVGIVIPVIAGMSSKFVDQNRRAPLGQE